MTLLRVDSDQGVHVGFMWENQPHGLTICNNSSESSKQQLDMKSMNQKEGINEGEEVVNKKRSRGKDVISSENNIATSEGKGGKYCDSDIKMHIQTERERRKKMRNMFYSLHALLPHLPPKADKSTIVKGAVEQIKNLEEVLKNLEKQKEEKLKSKYVPLSFECEPSLKNSQLHTYESRDTVIANQVPSSYNLPNAIVTSNPSNEFSTPPSQVAFQTYSSQNVVLNTCGGEAQFCICATKNQGLMTTIAFVLEKYNIDVISANIMCNENGNFYMILAHARQASNQFEDANPIEETYKQAAAEIMMWIS